MKSIVMGVMMTVSATLLADTLYWYGDPSVGNRDGNWMADDMWLDAATGNLVTWQENDTHDVIFDSSRVGGTGWFTHIGIPSDGVTPNSVVVAANLQACRFRHDTNDPGTPGSIFTPEFTAMGRGDVTFYDGVTLQALHLVVDGANGGLFKYENLGIGALSLCDTAVLTNNATVTSTAGGIVTCAFDVYGTARATQGNYGQGYGNQWTLAGPITLNPGALLIQAEASYQWRPYEISGAITLLGDAGIQGGTGDQNTTVISGGVTGAHTLTLHVVGTNPNGGKIIRDGAWDVAGVTKTGTGRLTVQVENLFGNFDEVQQKKEAILSIQEGLVKLSAPQVVKTLQLGSDIITGVGTYTIAELDPGNLYFTADYIGALTIPPPGGTVILLR